MHIYQVKSQSQAEQAQMSYLDPLLIGQCRPHMVQLGDDGLVRAQQHARLVNVDMQSTQYQDQAIEGSVTGDGLQPVVIDVEEHHLWLAGLQN